MRVAGAKFGTLVRNEKVAGSIPVGSTILDIQYQGLEGTFHP